MLAVVDPVGPFSEPVAKVARMVSLSPTFQTQAGFSNDTDALTRIFYREARPAVVQRPFAIVRPGDQFGFRSVSGGTSENLRANGSVMLHLEIGIPKELIPPPDSLPHQAELYAANFFGQVLVDVVGLAGADDGASDSSHLPIVDMATLHFGHNPPIDWPIDEIGAFYGIIVQFTWGVGQ